MKRAILLLLAVVLTVGLTGCVKKFGRRPWACMGGSCAQAPENCQSCDASCGAGCEASCDPSSEPTCREKLCARLRCKRAGVPEETEAAPTPPQTGAVAYPYYTTRGPRDFLAKNPPSIGP
jgi:hypothetical protein